MKLIVALVAACVALCATAPPASADVWNGSKWECGDFGQATIGVKQYITMNEVGVTTTLNGNTSLEVRGTPGDAGGASCSACPKMGVGTGEGRLETKIEGGKLKYKNSNGDWIDARKPRKTKPMGPMTGGWHEPVDDGDLDPPAPLVGGSSYNDVARGGDEGGELVPSTARGPDEGGEIVPRAGGPMFDDLASPLIRWLPPPPG